MKTKRNPQKGTKRTLMPKGKKGFALIATITLMILLALLSIGLLSVATTQIRLSEKGLHASEAKAMAKMALEVAIGNLQAELGPDQRISANSSIMDASPTSTDISGNFNPHLLGAWNSWDTWLNRKNSQGQQIASTYTRGREQLFRKWLISTPDLRESTKFQIPELGNNRGNTKLKVQLVGSGVLGDDRTEKNTIYAGLVQIDDGVNVNNKIISKRNSQIRKNIAWWVAGENQKVRINLPGYLSNYGNERMEVLRRTWDTPIPNNNSIDELRQLTGTLPSKSSAEYDQKIRQLITTGTLQLAAGQRSAGDLGMVYHDISLVSSGLPTDVKFGGLKKDMSIMLSKDELPDDYRSDEQSDIGLRPYSREDGSAFLSERPISSWNQLHLWSNVWDSQTRRNGQDETASIQWSGSTPYTLVAGDANAVNGMLNNRYTYLRQPILLKLYSLVGIQYGLKGLAPYGKPTNYGNVVIRTSIFPVQVWWNPYNVELPMKGAQEAPMGAYVAQYRMMPLLASDNVASDLRDPVTSSDYFDYRPANAEDKINDDKFSDLVEYGLSGVLRGPLDKGGTCANSYVGYNNKAGRQVIDYGSSFRQTVEVRAKKDNSSENGKVTKGEISVLRPGEIVIFSYPEVFVGIVDSSYYNLNVIEYVRRTQQDYAVDYMPMSEGWSENEGQTAAWAILAKESMHELRYDGLTGPDYPDEGKYRLNIRFAESTDQLITPTSFLIAKKFSQDNSKDLGVFGFQAGIFDVGMIGSTHPPKSQDQGGSNDPEIFAKSLPSVFNLNWGAWEEKLVDSVTYSQDYWDNYKNVTGNRTEEQAKQGWWGGPKGNSTADGNSGQSAVFIAYYGISNKWGSNPIIGTYPKDRDYRAKTWQHSTPLFWGSQMNNPSELGRAYHPYQFELNFATNDFSPVTIANILSNDGTRSNIFGGPGSEEINRIIAAELPFHPPFSLAGFAGMRLTPGWYNTVERAKTAKRFAYQSGVPGVGIGNAFADPMLPPDQIFSHNEITNDPELGDFWDHALMVNDGLWDSWYTSSMATRPTGLGSSTNKETYETVIENAFRIDPNDQNATNNQNMLPNRRFSIKHQGTQLETIVSELTSEDGYSKSAKYVRIDGAFNVNSTSIVAWKAILTGLKERDILYMNDGNPDVLNKNNNTTVFSRFGIATHKDSHVDDLGVVGVSNGIMDGDTQSWTDLRKYDERQMEQFAEKIVEQVKKRGPFLNMSEFVNRRLQSGELGLKGALQTAIDDSGMNSVFDSMTDKILSPPVNYPHSEASKGSYYTAAPGYLIQSDVLAVLGNILTVRDDTFTIRAYGELTNKDGSQILSRAWCEATVQRMIDYVDPSDEPEKSVTKINTKNGSLEDNGLSKINKAFGRKFEVTSFRWLASNEI